MGCDIHTHLERLDTEGNWQWVPDLRFMNEGRNYAVYDWLGDNITSAKTGLPPCPNAVYGIPPDMSKQLREHGDRVGWWDFDYDEARHWVLLEDLLHFDYDQPCVNMRSAKANGGKGEQTTYRELFGEWYFTELARMKAAGISRIIYSFGL